MKNVRYGKIVLCLLALAVVSGLAGGFFGYRLARHRLEQRDNPETWNETAMRTFDRTVQPGPEQRVKIKACLDTAIAALKAIRADTIARSTNVIWRLVEQVEKELTPEQAAAFAKMKPTQGELSTLDLLQVDAPPKK